MFQMVGTLIKQSKLFFITEAIKNVISTLPSCWERPPQVL